MRLSSGRIHKLEMHNRVEKTPILMVTETEIGVYDKSITSPTFDVTMSMCIRHEQEETYTRFFIANSIVDTF